MKTNKEIMKNLFLSYLEKQDGKNKPVTLNISANNATNRLAIVIGMLKYSAINGIIPAILKNVDSEKAIKNKLRVTFLDMSLTFPFYVKYLSMDYNIILHNNYIKNYSKS